MGEVDEQELFGITSLGNSPFEVALPVLAGENTVSFGQITFRVNGAPRR